MVQLKINGKSHKFGGDKDMPLLWYLRDDAELTGTKFSCGEGICGACTVHLDGFATRSCQLPMGDLEGASIVTIEGLSEGGSHPLQVAWEEHAVPQCGYCQAGQVMQAASLLAENPSPTDQEIEDAMYGNICRCGTYQRIKAAIRSVKGDA